MNIKEVINFKYLNIYGNSEIVEFNNLTYDTRNINAGDCFICIKGRNFDAHASIEEIILKRPNIIIVENKSEDFVYKIKSICEKNNVDINILYYNFTRMALALISAYVFDYAYKKMTVIGVTGTKGKTTTTHMIKRILEKNNIKTGMIGTNGIYIGDEYIKTVNTTPESYKLHQLFKQMYDDGVTHVVMEVSSQAVKQYRVYGMEFDYGIFTNISVDHIGPDEHSDFDDYLYCKTKFLQSCKQVFINNDDEHIEYIKNNLMKTKYFTFGMTKESDYYVDKVEYEVNNDFVGFKLNIKGMADINSSVSMAGDFNVYNALAAIILCNELVSDKNILVNGLNDIYVDGRMETVYKDDKITVIVDYAHNAVSMEKLLKALRLYNPKRLVVVFGSGGNRSKDRRHMMGETADKMADFSIITSDNSRHEKAEDIINDIASKMPNKKYIKITDREEAIRYSIKEAQPGDIIAVIGKGHEDYQEENGVRKYFKDSEVIKKVVRELL